MSRKPSAGGFIATYCTRCRLDLGHTIIAMTGEKIVRVKCRTCGSEHNYREKTKKKTPTPETGKRSVKRESLIKSPEKQWEAAMAKASGEEEILYDMGRKYREGEIVSHPTFGKGVVVKRAEKKVTILFKEQERTLVSANR